MDLARIEAGDIRLRRNWGPIEEIIDAAVARAEPLLRQHQLRTVVEKELPVIRVDARGVAEVIYTLLDNASKYAQPNTLVTIQAERTGETWLRFPLRIRERASPTICVKRFLKNSIAILAREYRDDLKESGWGCRLPKELLKRMAGAFGSRTGAPGMGLE